MGLTWGGGSKNFKPHIGNEFGLLVTGVSSDVQNPGVLGHFQATPIPGDFTSI
jgi:hypothetical protein